MANGLPDKMQQLFPGLHDLDFQRLSSLSTYFKKVTYGRDHVVAHQGSDVDGIFLVVSGTVSGMTTVARLQGGSLDVSQLVLTKKGLNEIAVKTEIGRTLLLKGPQSKHASTTKEVEVSRVDVGGCFGCVRRGTGSGSPPQ